MLRAGAFERAVRGLLEQSAGPGRVLAPVLHLHAAGGWQHLTVNLGSASELAGSLEEARHLAEADRVDAFVCILRREHSRPLAEGLGVRADGADELGYAAESASGDVAQTAGLEELREAFARIVLRR